MRRLVLVLLLLASPAFAQQDLDYAKLSRIQNVFGFKVVDGCAKPCLLTLTGAFPATVSSATQAVQINVTSAPSGGTITNSQRAFQVNFTDGGAGSSQATTAVLGANSITNVGASAYNIQIGGANGGRFVSNGVSPVFAVGSFGQVNNNNGGTPTTAFGSYGLVNAGAAGTAVGTAGFAQAGTVRVAGWFSLDTTSAPLPPVASAVIVADNAAQSVDIFQGENNGAIAFDLGPTGNVTLGDPVGKASATSRSISGEPGLGTDKAGGSVTIHSGIGTGAGAVSSFVLDTPEAGASSSTAQTEIVSFDRSQKSYAMADASDVAIFTVALPTSNTGCGAQISVSYQATGGGNTVAHDGIVGFAFTNNGGTVSGTAAESGEIVNGTGCAAGCDAYTVTVVGTTATAKANFNNTLSVTGALRYALSFNTCQSYARQ